MATIIQPVRNLPNGTRINGVAHFCQASNPLSRVDGSPLVVGDRNYRVDLGIDTFWNGTYWLSPEEKYQVYNITTIPNSTNTLTLASFVFPSNLFLLKTITTNWIWAYVDQFNFWSVQLQYARRLTTPISIGSPIQSSLINNGLRDTKIVNTVFDLSQSGAAEPFIFRIGYNAVRTGSVSSLFLMGLEFKCHEIIF